MTLKQYLENEIKEITSKIEKIREKQKQVEQNSKLEMYLEGKIDSLGYLLIDKQDELRKLEEPKGITTWQAMAVIASVMRYGNPKGIKEENDYFEENEENGVYAFEYQNEQWELLQHEHSELFSLETTEEELQKEIKGEN